jgi:hypothetical protein
MKVLLISAVFFLLHTSLYADIEGIGFGKNNDEAKKEALSDLSQNIKCEVRSSFSNNVSDNGGTISNQASSSLQISSDLPIMGAEFTYHNSEEGVKASAILNSIKVSNAYKEKLNSLVEQISANYKLATSQGENTTKLKELEEIYSLLVEYDRYSTVAAILHVQGIVKPTIVKSQIQTDLNKINSNIDSVSMAAAVLGSYFNEKNIYLYPPRIQNYTTVSEFGSVFANELKGKINSAVSLKTASYILTGDYVQTVNSLILNYRLLNTLDNSIIKTKTITLASSIYKQLKVQPDNVDFDVLLNKGIITSSKFNVSLNSNKGSNNLLFKKGESVELFVKLNQMGYVYVMGYTQAQEKKLSYLLELNEANGDDRFIKFINIDDASKWVSLGEFTVEPPYGIESLQVIASSKKPQEIPFTQFNSNNGYYVISKDLKKALISARGLVLKKNDKIQTSEDVLSFATVR